MINVFNFFSGFYCYGPLPDLTANNFVAVMPYANISGNARYHCLDPDNTKVEFHWRGHLDVKCLIGNTYEMPDPIPSCISEVVCTDTPGKAKNLYPNCRHLGPGIYVKYFLSLSQKICHQRKLRQTKCLLFNF